MPRILLIAPLVLALALCGAAAVGGQPVDSKAWGKVSTTTGPPRPGAIDDHRAKRAVLDSLARPLKPRSGAGQVWRVSPTELPSGSSSRTLGTSRPCTGAELAAREAGIRAKIEATIHPAPAPRSLAGPAILPPKSGVTPAPRAAPTGHARSTSPVTRTEIPGTPLNDEQRAKLERARAAQQAGAVARPPQDHR